jgi:hypothetical protein
MRPLEALQAEVVAHLMARRYLMILKVRRQLA